MNKLRRNLHKFCLVCGVIGILIGLAQCQQPLQSSSVNGTFNAQTNNNNNAARHQQHQQQSHRLQSWPAYDIASIPAIGRYQQQTNGGGGGGSGINGPISYATTHRGRKNRFNELRENLSNATQQAKYWERQGDDPERMNNKTNPIREIKQKILLSDVSTCQIK